MSLYCAYFLIVLHVAFGAMQSEQKPALLSAVVSSFVLLTSLHVIADYKGRQEASKQRQDYWMEVGLASSFVEGCARIFHPKEGEVVAVFNHKGKLSAISNLCAHQNGPLGEGRIINGCIVCPWHGFEYKLIDGCAPAPFTEKIATYRLKLEGDIVLLDVRANPPGTPVEPVMLPEGVVS